jgi:hypothetical protein
MKLISDTESDGFKYEATRLWCIVSFDPDAKRWYISSPEDMRNLIKVNYPHLHHDYISFTDHIALLGSSEKLVMHNGIMHDAPLIKKLYGKNLSNIEDTFIMSSLFNPDRMSPKGWVGQPKPHSIAAYAHRFGMVKVGHEDWSCFSWNMLDRCINDVMVGYKTHEYLLKEATQWDWKLSLKLEHAVAHLQAEQEMHGVLFDKERAIILRDQIDKELEMIEANVLDNIPKRVKQVGVTITKPFLKDGSYSKSVLEWIGEDRHE